MASISLADQLDDAIEMMIAEPGLAPPKVDLKIGELLRIAGELRLLPDPAFRAALKAELAGGGAALVTEREVRRPSLERGGPRRDERIDAILPSLFGAGYGNYPVQRGNFAISMAIHAAIIVAVASAGLWMTIEPKLTTRVSTTLLTDVSPYVLSASVTKSKGGGGGGGNDTLAESKGRLPLVARDQITPPSFIVRSEPAKLAVDPTVVGPPELTMPRTSQIGNPLSAILQTPSNGIGYGGGIGNGHGGGIGSDEGPGFGPGHGGGMGGGAYTVGGGVSAPRAIYDPDPEYSEEARQAKYQGTVLLWVVVGANGRAREIRVQRSLGMGLDEKAVEAVREWRFEPGVKDRVPVAVQVIIEVSFRLL